MGLTMQQPKAPQPAHGILPPSMAPPQKVAHSDMFLDMIQGNSITVIVGQHPSSRSYTLPAILLSVHSIFFRDHIARINATESKDRATSKKRKIISINDDGVVENNEVVIKEEEGKEMPAEKMNTKDTTGDEDKVIRLPDVDPAIFGLFLKFMYKDVYPTNVDARMVPSNFHLYSWTTNAKATPSVSATTPASQQLLPKIWPQNSSTNTQATSPPSNMPILRPNPAPTNMPPPPPPQVLSQTQFIPPSIQAWLLAQRLGALSFMNHAIQHIFYAIGVYFALTPSLMDHVWRETSPSPTSPTILTPSPLRKLLLHILVSHWSTPSPPNNQNPTQNQNQNPNAVILRSLSVSPNFSTSLKDAWDQLFSEHADLRNEFIHGLQGGVAVGDVGAYFASSAPVVGGVGVGVRDLGTGGKVGGEVLEEKGKDESRVERDGVVVKVEKDAES